jgi:hypothetical protein
MMTSSNDNHAYGWRFDDSAEAVKADRLGGLLPEVPWTDPPPPAKPASRVRERLRRAEATNVDVLDAVTRFQSDLMAMNCQQDVLAVVDQVNLMFKRLLDERVRSLDEKQP